ncbi:hypothetical protein CYMTET_8376 [Cymbomonas tetramitiformis]|uniref:Glycine--tRNA ligase n=1 Tax=Cymbomonas tetramitiformis TaxID=36881 RepID=A0AAE0GTL4_9CHLO|nr:hypothetical protein CYMTET_8376 [Cymbomonas tetramitiformis]|eukprot:gene4361-5367_t
MAAEGMTPEELEAALQAKAQETEKQADTVRAMKAKKEEKAVVAAAVDKLKELKKELAELTKAQAASDTAGADNKQVFRANLNKVLEQNLFFIPSFKIYGGVGGLYDYGPTGAAVKSNLTEFWRSHFVLEENMLPIECPAVTPHCVLKASGHVDRFLDMMVHDMETKAFFRADHLLGDFLEKLIAAEKDAAKKHELELVLARLDEYKQEELGALIKQFDIKAPETGNALSEPYPFNLMFQTQIGPAGNSIGFMRPETAQGIFVNFKELLYYNGNKLPFAAAQIGQSYRNEIAPRAGLLRVREFTQFEIEHFVDPEDKSHKKFKRVADIAFNLYPREEQLQAKGTVKLSLGDALSKGIIANETLAYFIGRTYLFLEKAGIDPERMRFRQHLQHEMAHYACDCWDAEIECSYGWVECVGLADRSAFDLDAHSKASKVDLTAFKKFDKPIETEVLQLDPQMKEVGKVFKKEAGLVKDALLALSDEQKTTMQAQLEGAGEAELAMESGTVKITPDTVKIKTVKKKISGKTFTPGVIEPSFGIGRIIYCLYEHSFYTRPGSEQRTVFRFSPVAAPIKCTVFPLLQQQKFEESTAQVAEALTRAGLSRKVDETGASIGKRYARTDEIGVPFAITVDHTTLEDNTVTLRERDSMEQVRIPLLEVAEVVRCLCEQHISWKDDVMSKYPRQEAKEE